MRIHSIFTLICLLATTFLSASSNPATPSITAPIESDFSCELPAPSDFHAVEQGPTSVKFAWTPIMDAVSHRIKVYRTSDGLLLNNTVVPAGQQKALISNLPLNTVMHATINTICQNGDDGPVSIVFPLKGFIMDLIVAGFTSGTESSCVIESAGQSCTFYTYGASITPFKVSRNSVSRQFGVSFELSGEGGPVFHTYAGTGNGDQTFKLNCDNDPLLPCGPTGKIIISYDLGGGSSMRAAVFELVQTTTTGVGKLRCISLSQGFIIDRMGPGPSGEFLPEPGKGKGPHIDDNHFAFSQLIASVSPNPFSESLEVFTNQTDAATINLQLFNLNGQKVLDQQFTGGQEQYSLSTTNLSPGFYMLRIEADGELQTLKVVKSE